jgi:hypothetical protein
MIGAGVVIAFNLAVLVLLALWSALEAPNYWD